MTPGSRFKSVGLLTLATFQTTSISKGSQDNNRAKRYGSRNKETSSPSRPAFCLLLAAKALASSRGVSETLQSDPGD